MNLRELAEQDLAVTLEDTIYSAANAVTFVSPTEEEFYVSALVGDIGYLLDTDGNPISGRCCCITWRMSSLWK